ncbi:MAG: LON peptidase substrate-binding domain-containing protein [Anaerolineaceae bacterium]
MSDIPVFPLNTVLFPGSSLRLRIFEERYQEMLRFCLESDQPFGVVLIRQGLEVGTDLVRTYSIGCTARIEESVPLGHGWSIIKVTGEERFHILDVPDAASFPTAQVEMRPLENLRLMEILDETKELMPWVTRYITLAAARQGKAVPKSLIHFPENPLTFLYQAADLLQIPLFEKQVLLETRTAAALASEVLRIYRRELSIDRDLSLSWLKGEEWLTREDIKVRPAPYQWFNQKYRIAGRRKEDLNSSAANLN